ncbi:MAG: beta strand repeat-containing protein [Hyalangium sp.]|uniref:beta strand repeat-containing protein n=1 Tax=Hyalangium sp. TaxID=2028555 RepID=UPI00389A4F2A
MASSSFSLRWWLALAALFLGVGCGSGTPPKPPPPPEEVTATKLAFTTTNIQGTAGSPLTPVVEVVLQDADGNKATGNTRAVTLALASGPASAQLEGTLTVNAVDGVARFSELIIKQAGTGYSLRATSGSLTAATSATFEVVHAAPSVLQLTGLPASLSVDATASAQVTLKDAFGNVATHYQGTLHFSSTDPSAVLPGDFTFTAADAGQKTFTGLALHTAGSQRVTVADTIKPALTASADVQVVAGAVSKLAFTQQPGNHSVRASLGTVQVSLTDAYGNPTALTAPAVTVALNPASAGLSGTTTVAPVGGVASFTTLSVTQEGTGYTLTATAPGLTGATSAAFNIVDDVPPAPPVLAQGATTASSIVVQWSAVGDDGNLGTASSQELRYSTSNIVTAADFAAATLVPTAAPKAAGTAESATLSGLISSTNYYVALKVTDNAGNSVRSATLPVSTANPAVTQLGFITQPVDGTAGTAMANVRVALQDASGNTVTSASSAVTLNLLNGPVFTPVTVTAVGGVATFSGMRIDTAGMGYQFQASSGSLPVKQSTAFSIRPSAAVSLEMVGLVAPVTAGIASSVQVTAYDAFGNVATGYTGTVHFTSSDPAADLPGTYDFAPSDKGQKSFPRVVLKTVGSQTVTVADTVTASLKDSLTVDVTSGAAGQLVITVPLLTVPAGNPFSLKVTVRDGSGNIATGYRGTVHVTSSDPSAVLPGDYTFTDQDAGEKIFLVRMRTAGSHSITVQDTANAALTSTQFFNVTAAPVATLKLTAPATATAGSAFSVTVTAQDAYGNVATGYTGTVQFSSGDAQATLPGNYTFASGDLGSRLFNVTLGTAGSQSLSVTDGSLSASASITVGPGTAASLALTGLPASVTAGTPASVTVTVHDAYGNVATGYTGTVHFTSTDASAVLPADYTFSGSELGTASFSVELRTAGARTVSVSGSGIASPGSASTTVSAAGAKQLVFSAQPADGTVRATLATVKVALQDTYGNPVSASVPTVTMGLSGGNGSATLSGTLSVNPSNGEASFTNLSIDQEGTGFQLVASAPGLTSATSTAFTLVDNLAPAAALISAAPEGTTGAAITWTAVGDDGNLGQAASYDLRYASAPITNAAQFAAATRFTIPAPQPAGAAETAHITGLDLSASVYFALKVIDGAGNSSLSNSPHVGGDPCEGVTCTPPANGCSADGRSVVSYTSACVNSGGVGVCQNTPVSSVTCHSYETCGAGACGAVTAASQAGSVIISEFSSLGSEFIELRNTTGASIDVHGFTLRNAADQEVDIRAISDPNGTAGTPVTVPANGVLYGIPNPSGAIPGGTGFVYGPPGTSFSMADSGDAIALYAAPPAGNLQDAVDFRTFNTNPDSPVTASHFIGFPGSSTQLDDAVVSAAGNDSATSWCVSFYGHNVRGSRITNTAGALNGSCKVAVINEVVVDPVGGDDGKWFMEIAGPGGSVIGGAQITDVVGKGSTAGQYNTLGAFPLPAGTRIPADGILLVVDTLNSNITQVPNFVAGVDVASRTFHLKASGGNAYQLISATGTLLDALGHDVNGANLDVNVATANGLAMYETGTALYPTTGNVAPSLSRSSSSTDTDNNFNDFHGDPSPTPGLPNDAVNLTVTSLTPDDGPAVAGAANMTIAGTDFTTNMRAAFGNNASSLCTANSSTSATCTAIANAGNVAQVNVTVSDPAPIKTPNAVLTSGFTYTGTLNGTSNPAQADYCVLQSPSTLSVQAGTTTAPVFGQIYEAGVTEAPGPAAGVLAEVGYGAYTGSPAAPTNPTNSNNWRFFPAVYNTLGPQGNNDEYMGSFVAPAAGTYAYTVRFSFDNGLNWTYCDLNGAGSNLGPTSFEPATQLGVMTVTP